MLKMDYIDFLKQTEQVNRAIQVTKEVVKNHPQEQKFRLGLAELYLKNQEQKLAEQTLLEPRWPAPYYMLAVMYMTGRMDQAIEKFEQVLNSTVNLRTAFLLGQLYEEQGNIKKAKSRYEYIIKENFDFYRLTITWFI